MLRVLSFHIKFIRKKTNSFHSDDHHPSKSLMAGRCKRQNGDVACPFKSYCHLPLMFCAVARDPSGNDLSAFRNKISEDLRVLIIDIQFFIRTESADLPPHKRLFLPVLGCSFSWPFHPILLVSFTFLHSFSLRQSVGPWRSPLSEFGFYLPVFASFAD